MTPKEAYLKCIKENRRIIELEEIIATDAYISYRYAIDIIKARWEKSEEVISKDAYASYWYSFKIICGPFEKGHHLIFNSEYKDKYINFLKSIDYDMTKIIEWLL